MATTEVDYRKGGTFSKTAFMTAYTAQFKNVPKYNAASIPDLVRMVEMMEQDPTITDIRWMAYMLATTFIESAETVKVKRQSKNKKGQVVVRTAKVWRELRANRGEGAWAHEALFSAGQGERTTHRISPSDGVGRRPMERDAEWSSASHRQEPRSRRATEQRRKSDI